MGTDASGSYTLATNLFGNNESYYRSFTASSDGSATSLYFYLGDPWSASNIKLMIWNSSGTLLAATGAIAISAAGWVSGAISSTSITASQTYYLGFVADSGYVVPYHDGTTWQVGIDTGSTYATPATLADTAEDELGYGKFAMYADGTTGGGSIVPQAMANYRMRAA